ncbi:MAG: hypothetical protein U0231_12140 [Nitrospiraceae bacterium]
MRYRAPELSAGSARSSSSADLDYSLQLREKQKLKRIYGLQEGRLAVFLNARNVKPV